jgi:hypothetical protein
MRDPKNELWFKIKKQKIEEFAEKGIMQCEICSGHPLDDPERQILSMAHSRKRRKIENEEQLAEVALLCIRCHRLLDGMTHEDMEREIKAIITRRDGLGGMFDD